MCYKKGKSLIFDVMKYGQIFPSKVCHLFENRFLFNREMGNIRSCKEVRLQKFIKSRLSKQNSFWHFLSQLRITDQLGRVFPSNFLKNVLTETSNICFKKFQNFLSCTLPFHLCDKVQQIENMLKEISFITFCNKTTRGGISILKGRIAYEGCHSL